VSSRLPIVQPPRAPQGPAQALAWQRPGASLPTVQARTALWQQVAQKPLWAPPHFWAYAKLRWRLRLRLLDPRAVPHGGRGTKRNDCTACTDICCVGAQATVLLRLKDIAMLQDLGRTDLISTVKPQFDPALVRARPALQLQVMSESWQRFPVLRQDSMHSCAALSREGKCTLYPHWPISCARFPYALRPQEPETFFSSRCQSFWVHPDAAPSGVQMASAAVAAYNERITDAILLAYRPGELQALGLLRYVAPA
jgi:Fe-S-cluster containining protein